MPQSNQYESFLKYVFENGTPKTDRTGTGTVSVFGGQLRFNLEEGFPLITTKKVHLKSIIHELLWFLKGETNIAYLKAHGVRIWDEWADAEGNLGPVYGKQWRSWEAKDGRVIDQISEAIQLIKNNPDSRRILVNAWNVGEIDKMALMPCHTMFQFYVANGKLSCQLYQRSADLFLGVPFNIASYALLTMMIAQVCGLQYGDFVHTFGDAHIYTNHFDQVNEQLSREPKAYPTMRMNPEVKDIFNFTYEDFTLENYDPWPAIKGAVAVWCMLDSEDNALTGQVLDAAIQVHKTLGPGLLESAYLECLYYKLQSMGLRVEKQKAVPLVFEEVSLEIGYRLDLLVEGTLVIELKSVEGLTDIHLAQTLTYLKLGNYQRGLLINFNVLLLKDGIKRVINKFYVKPR